MGSAFSSFQERRKARKELKRKRKLYSSETSFEREEVMKIKAQMEQQIEALAKQISIEERALFAKTSKLLQLAKSVWSLESQEPAENHLEATELQYGQFELSEGQAVHRLMREACLFDQYNREHPLEKWTVGSLPNLYKCSLVKCHPTYWEV